MLERALERADASLGDVRARVDAGVLPPNDVLSAQAQRARQNVRLIQARNDAALAEADLARLVGRRAGTADRADHAGRSAAIAGVAELAGAAGRRR